MCFLCQSHFSGLLIRFESIRLNTDTKKTPPGGWWRLRTQLCILLRKIMVATSVCTTKKVTKIKKGSTGNKTLYAKWKKK